MRGLKVILLLFLKHISEERKKLVDGLKILKKYGIDLMHNLNRDISLKEKSIICLQVTRELLGVKDELLEEDYIQLGDIFLERAYWNVLVL